MPVLTAGNRAKIVKHAQICETFAGKAQKVIGTPTFMSNSETDHQTANDIARGTERLLANMGLTSIREFSLVSGRRIDVAALAKDGTLHFIEIKSSLADFRSDQKWPEYLDYCDTFSFAVAPDFPREVLPEAHGLIIADRYGAERLREDGAAERLGAARRKAVTLRFARVAASRLMAVVERGETVDMDLAGEDLL